MRLAVFALLMAWSAAACGPRVDAAAKLDIDRRVAAFVPSGRSFPPPGGLLPKPLAVGQWTQHRLTSETGEHALVTYKIVGEEAGATWVEVANESYRGKTVGKLLVVVGDRGNPGTMEIRALRTKNERGEHAEVAGPALERARPTWQRTLNMLAVAWAGLSQEPASAVAGDFAACFVARIDASWGGWHAAATAWMHPLVPINSLVRSVGLDGTSTMELVGFGDEGATSELPQAIVERAR